MKSKNCFSWNEDKGFSMVELMVVLVIIIIGTSIAVVTFQNRSSYYRLKGSTREVLELMKLAQATAIRKNLQHRLVLSSKTTFNFQEFSASAVGGYANVTNESGRLGLTSIPLQNGIRFTANPCTSGTTYPCFTPVFRTDGTIAAGSGGTSLRLTDGKDTRQVQWTIGGGIRVP